MNSVFSEQILADKLSKLNSTQQCIETLSHLCIFHQSKAELIVKTWSKQFHSSEIVQKVPLLYLANDIIQNSKRKGNEFVTEFWKVLPAAIKDLTEKGDDAVKSRISRLVKIWEERRVFGSGAKSIKNVMLGEELPQPLELSKKRSRSIKIMRRDSRSIRTKLTIGDTTEKIVSAFHLVLSEHTTEHEEMNKCKSVVHRVRKMEKDVDSALTQANDPKRKTLAKELEEDGNILNQCVEKLKVVEANRLALVSQLRDALNEQESELENVRTQMQVAHAQAEETATLRKQLNDENYVADSKPSTATPPLVDANAKGQTPKKSAAAIAAEVADRLAASSSSQYIMSSVLSEFAAEAKNAGLTNPTTVSNTFPSQPNNIVSNSISKPEQSYTVSDPNSFMQAQPLNVQTNNHYHSVMMSQPAMQSQVPNSQPQYLTLANPPQQYLQPSGNIVTSYGYGNGLPMTPAPQPPPLTYMMNPMVPMSQQQHFTVSDQQSAFPQHNPMPMPVAQQPPAPPNFRPLQPPGMMYYTLPHQQQ